MHVQVTRAMKEHLVARDNWQLVHQIYRHVTSAGADSAARHSFQPRESNTEAAVGVEEALGYSFARQDLRETALTHSCAPRLACTHTCSVCCKRK